MLVYVSVYVSTYTVSICSRIYYYTVGPPLYKVHLYIQIVHYIYKEVPLYVILLFDLLDSIGGGASIENISNYL